MIEVDNIHEEIGKGSTGCFKNKYGSVFYLLNGSLHREDGPAVLFENGVREWWWYGSYAISEEQFYDLDWRRVVEIERFL